MVTRRRVLGTGIPAVAAVAGTGAALRPMLTAGGVPGAYGPVAQRRTGARGDFDEVYRGRRIQGFGAGGGGRVPVLLDGRPLHLMRRADGSWISMANHFQPYPTPLAT